MADKKQLPWCACSRKPDGSWRPVGGSWKIGSTGGTHRAVMCSEFTGIVGVDIDKKNGRDGFKSLKDTGIVLPKTSTRCSTPHGGEHHLFKRPASWKDKDISGCEILPGVEVKTRGTLVMDGPDYTLTANKLLVLPKSIEKSVRKNSGAHSTASPIPSKIQSGERNKELTSLAGTLRRRGVDKDGIIILLQHENKKCRPPLPDSEIQKIADGIQRYAPTTSLRTTQWAAAELFADMNCDKVKFDHDIEKWFIWSGRRWEPDSEKKIYAYMDDVVFAYRSAAMVKGISDFERENFHRFANSLEQMPTVKNVLSYAESREPLRVSRDPWDRDDLKFNVRNGVVDLKSCSLMKHDPDEMISRVANVAYSPKAKCPKWMDFLEAVQPQSSVRNFLQRWIGYCLSGLTDEQVFVFLFGSGANGKSVFDRTMEHILGDYYTRIRSETLMQKGQRDDMIHLRGSRMAACTEVEKGNHVAEGTLKDLTGGDTVTARPLYKQSIRFRPTHKLMLIGNHKPLISDNSPALWRRVLLVPFDVTIQKDKRRPMNDLLAGYKKESSGILNWALDGFQDYRSRGLAPPKTIQASIKSYQMESDVVRDFYESQMKSKTVYEKKFSDVYNQYLMWCSTEMKKHVSKRAFKKGLEEIGGIFRKKKQGIYVNFRGEK